MLCESHVCVSKPIIDMVVVVSRTEAVNISLRQRTSCSLDEGSVILGDVQNKIAGHFQLSIWSLFNQVSVSVKINRLSVRSLKH